jgi:FtsP/CotA-like multicopper oxidase with cupredoxin domain
MLSRRHLLFGSGCALALRAARAQAGTAPDVTVLNAGRDGFNGAVPGPVIRARRGDEVRARLVNGLGEPAALCWHGVRTANALDGSAALPLAAPGASLDYHFTAPDAGTFWYRAAGRAQQEAGLYGALIVEEPSPPTDQDHVIVFDSRPSGSGGTRRFTVNGAAALDIAVRTNERLRLRFINASTAQVMDARIDKHRVMMMALDGEPAEPFASRDGGIVLGPGNRADVFVDAVLGPGAVAPITFAVENGVPPALRLVYGDAPARGAPLGEPAPLPPNPLPERMNFSRALRVTLPIESGDSPSKPQPRAPQALFTAERGRTVVMALDSRAARVHVVHLHGHHFRLLDRLDDGWKPYWLDTIPVPPRQTARIAFVADNPGRWRIENRAIGAATAPENEAWFEVR